MKRRASPGVNQKLIDELRDHVRKGQPYTLTFSPLGKMTKKEEAVLQAHLKNRFETWANIWVLPWINQIEAKLIRTKKVKP